MENRKEIKINKLVGRIGNEYYFVDEFFLYNDGFKGVTGTIMRPMTKEEYNERVEEFFSYENMREFWQQAVEAGNTELGLDDWIQLVKDTDGEEFVIDRSYASSYGVKLNNLLGNEEAFEVECVGGGRCFDYKMKWDELYNKKLWELIREFEKDKKQRTGEFRGVSDEYLFNKIK